MALGTVYVRIELDDPTRIYYGPEDPVQGNVVLRYTPDHRSKVTSELFGPLQIQVKLSGALRVDHGRSANTRLLTIPRELFHQQDRIYDGPFRAEPGSEHRFPFTVFFPGMK